MSQYTGAGDQQAPAVSQSEASGFTLSGGAGAGGADPSTSGGGLSDTNLTTSQMSVDTSTLGANSHANAYRRSQEQPPPVVMPLAMLISWPAPKPWQSDSRPC